MKKAKRISQNDLPALKEAYEQAVQGGVDVFTVGLEDGEGEFVTDYAKYLIQWFEKPRYEIL